MARLAAALALLLSTAVAWGEVLVIPRHAGKSPLRTFKNDWMSIDLAIGPLEQPGAAKGDGGTQTATGHLLLFFDQNEREMAEHAAASIEQSYRKLAKEFRFVPDRTFPYVLYSSYPEFLETNLFPLQEGVLGVTSPIDLKLTLPYLGDERLFDEVSTHELAHQFTIQKLRAVGGGEGSPIERFPLWFIEGIAEFYARGGLDAEAEVLLRDLIANPDPSRGHVLPGFFDEAIPSFLMIYKLGQAKCVFLEETYGAGTLQKVLDQSTVLITGPGGGFSRVVTPFEGLLHQVTGDPPATIAQKFESWIKRRAFHTYVTSAQDLAAFAPVPEIDAHVLSMSTSPTGELAVLKTLELLTGQTRLTLIHPQRPERSRTVVVDGVPGYDSLHPIGGRSFDLGRTKLAFVAERQGRDVLHVQGYRIDKEGGSPKLDGRQSIPLRERGIIAVTSVALSPDERRVALVGLDNTGHRDIYVLELVSPEQKLTRLTRDDHAERDVSWGPQGILYNSSATESRHFNLFLALPDQPGEVERLTSEGRDHLHPRALPDGRVVFVAFESGRANLFEVRDGSVLRRTDVVTGMIEPGPGPQGGLWVLWLHGGRYLPALLEPKDLGPVESVEADAPVAAAPLARRSLEGAQAYRPLSPGSWELGPVFGMVGGGAGGIAGQIFAVANDRLRDHALVLNAAAFGSLRLTEGLLLYLNQEQRIGWGVGAFQMLRFRVDPTFPDLPVMFMSVERYRGAMGAVRYPFSTYVYAEGELSIGVNERFLLEPEELFLADPEFNGRGELLPEWQAQNRGAPLQLEPTLRLGYDTLRHHAFSGPISGSSLLLELSGGVQPSRREAYQRVRLDAERVFPLVGRFRFHARTGAGATTGGSLATGFYLSSYDTLRGVPFGDPAWLLGRNFVFGTGELRAPLDPIIRILIIPTIEALAAVDAGAVSDSFDSLFARRVVDLVLGLDFSLGPFLLRLHFARPINTGAPAGLPVTEGTWVPNFSIRIAGLPGWVFGAAGPHAPK